MDRTAIQQDPERIIRKGLLQARKHRQETGDTDCMLVRLSRFWAWLQYRQCFIRDVHGQIVPLVPNRAQQMLFAVMLLLALIDRPIRIVVLKARKVGISTFWQAWAYFCCKFIRNTKAIMLAHHATSTDEIFDIAKTFAMYDQFTRPRTTERLITFQSHSTYWCHTAGGENVAAGGTPSMLHRSELALWKPGIKRRSDTTSGRAVPMTPTSCILDESTARGQELFWARFRAARHDWHPFEPLFIPWFVDATLRAPVPDGGLRLDDDEAALARRAARWGMEIPMEALAWRRLVVADIGLAEFKQEHPSTPDEAVESKRGLVVPGLQDCVIAADALPFDYRRVDVNKRFGGWDHGYNHPTATLSMIAWDGAVYVIDCHAKRGLLAHQHAEYVMPGHTYYCDPAALQARMEVQRACHDAGIPAKFLPAPRLRNPKTGEIENSEWALVRKYAEQGRLFIVDTCADEIIAEAENLEWDEQAGRPKRITWTPEMGDFDWGHFDRLDGLRYGLVGIHLRDQAIPVAPAEAPRRASRREQLRRW